MRRGATRDGDFARFPGLRWRRPFVCTAYGLSVPCVIGTGKVALETASPSVRGFQRPVGSED